MDRQAFKNRMQQLKQYREQNPGKGYLDWKASLPDNLQDESNYNLQRAYELGYEPEYIEKDRSYHLPTRDSETGEILKKPWHPTFLIGLQEDTRLGYYPQTINGTTYTTTWEGNENPIYKYADGGEIEYDLPEVTITGRKLDKLKPYGNITNMVSPNIQQPTAVSQDVDNVITAKRVNKAIPFGNFSSMVNAPQLPTKLNMLNNITEQYPVIEDLNSNPQIRSDINSVSTMPSIANVDTPMTSIPTQEVIQPVIDEISPIQQELGNYDPELSRRTSNNRFTTNFQEERDWLINFAKERSKLPEFADQLDNDQLTKYLFRVNNATVRTSKDGRGLPTNAAGVTRYDMNYNIPYDSDDFYNTGASITVAEDPTYGGANVTPYSQDLYSNIIHELDHATQMSTAHGATKRSGFSKRVQKVADIMGTDLDKGPAMYGAQPWEVLSRRQQMFHEMKADPNKKYTKKDLKSLRGYLKKYDLDFLGDDKVLKLLNEVAEAKPTQQDDYLGILDNKVFHAAKGGEIPPVNKPIIPEKPQPYKGKLYKDRYGRKYTEDQMNEYYDNGTDEIDRFTGKPFIRGLKPVGDIEDAANATPVGDVISAYDTYQALKNKDWEGAGLAAMGLVPFMPRLGGAVAKSSKKISKPKSTYIPKVDPNYKQNVIDRALQEQKNYSDMPLHLVEEINDQRNRTYDLMQEPYARERAKAIDHQYGTDYLKVYDSMLEKYVNIDEYFQLPKPEYKKMDRPTIGAQVTPSKGNTMYFNRDMIKTLEDIPNSVVLHEMGHLVDGAVGMNNEFLRKLGDKSKFIPFNQARTMYPNMTREMYNNILQGTEIKSYMNQFRNYLDQKGKLNRGNYTGGYKNLKKEIIEAPKESFNNIKAIFNLYRSPKLFNKDFQMIPIVNRTNDNTVA